MALTDPIVLADVLAEVRRALDEYTLDGELVALDTAVEDTTSSNFSDEDLQDRALDGARYIAARVRAGHIPDLVSSINPTFAAQITVADGGQRTLGFGFWVVA